MKETDETLEADIPVNVVGDLQKPNRILVSIIMESIFKEFVNGEEIAYYNPLSGRGSTHFRISF